MTKFIGFICGRIYMWFDIELPLDYRLLKRIELLTFFLLLLLVCVCVSRLLVEKVRLLYRDSVTLERVE